MSVLAIGIGSVSRLNFIKMLPQTYQHLTENQWIDMKSYNTVDDSAFQNIMAMLTGMNRSTTKDTCNPKKDKYLDKCNFLFFKYGEAGYTTAFVEDTSYDGIFSNLRKGFKNPPTDYYFRPYILASEKLPIQNIKGRYCSGPETAGERVMNVALDFAKTFSNFSSFGLFWMNSFTYDSVNTLSTMDEKLVQLLTELKTSGALNRTFVIFFSDHGHSQSAQNSNNWKEERLPFLFLLLPEWFRKNYPNAMANLKANSDKLISAYNIYMTLQDILSKSKKDYKIETASGCPQCKSLFDQLKTGRSCQDVGVTQRWCACNNLRTISVHNPLAKEAALSIIEHIENVKNNSKIETKWCVKFELKYVISVDISQVAHKWNTIMVVTFETSSEARFEGTVELVPLAKKYKYVIQGDIIRLDGFEDNSFCVVDVYLKQFCYCPFLK